MIKVIATDLDGTLFYPKRLRNMIPSKNIKLLKEFKEQGGHVVLVSGRSHFYAEKVIKRLGFMVDSICCNSAVVHHGEELIEENFLPNNFPEILKDIENHFPVSGQILMSKDVPVAVKSSGESRFNDILFSIVYSLQGVYKEKYSIDPKVWQEEMRKGKIYKFMLYFGSSKKSKEYAEKANEFLNLNYPTLTSAFSSGSIEITNKGVTKAEGLRKYCEKYNIKPEEVIVCGDSGNDISMFEAFPTHSFVMSHAPESVKKYARNIIKKVSDLEPYIAKFNSESEM